jgi:hypothetical protein
MGRFPVQYEHDHLKNQVILGPCPGCFAWTLQYDKFQILEVFDSVQDFHDYVEDLLQKHLAECSGLREIVAELDRNTP